ncbi:MAG: nucleotidyl transferase AbiEii/AbiGii toxin family protein, partial [Clostridia bacterium]|nr:nucleotidyl transferase AbiEii/AbiGii toxin family protein [Clostridia bacterium]
AKDIVISFLQRLIVPTEQEQKFIDEFKSRNYNPTLLFQNPQHISNISHHPMALWRCRSN